MKLPAKYFHLTFSALMALVMVTLMTFVVTWANIGFGPGFLARWSHAWMIAYSIALPVIYIFAPRVRRFVTRWVTEPR